MFDIDLTQDAPYQHSSPTSLGKRLSSCPQDQSCGHEFGHLDWSNLSDAHDDFLSSALSQPCRMDGTSLFNTVIAGTQLKKQKINNKVASSQSVDLSAEMDVVARKVPKCPRLKPMKKVGSEKSTDSQEDDDFIVSTVESAKIRTPPKANKARKQKKIVKVTMLIDSSLDSASNKSAVGSLAGQLALRGDDNFNFTPHEITSGLIKWIQNTEIVGFESSSTIINFAVLIIDPTEYIELCFKSKDNISYADLGATIDQFFDQILLDCPKNTRLSLILIDLEGSLNKYIKKDKDNNNLRVSTEGVSALIDSAAVYLLMDKNVTVLNYKSMALAAEYLSNVTTQYHFQATRMAPSHTLRRSTKPPEELRLSLSQSELTAWRRLQMWINMLSKVPGLGLIKAKVIAQTYTCPMQLINVYNEPNLSKKFKQDLIQNLLSDDTAIRDSAKSKPKIERKLSLKIYEIFTSINPKSKFDDGI